MKINTPLGVSANYEPESNDNGLISEIRGTVNGEYPYIWNKTKNAFEFVNGTQFRCPVSFKTSEEA